ncbi:DNA repair protein RadA [Desulfobulbus oligotrophicus]|uniref:DNA repair protein RadA n=1 Tax=Desulfobulbus oligotrophicus TaxID=1909699 RepID=A0A7T5VAX4_9BACT|nr:DNA repair protein RadA [Desulfobulbus oligotrophicus]QQG64525.1 DNA repair protein RadA [Desulfobulbus oligotrophicus]
MQTAKKNSPFFVCGQCGLESRKWLGRCPDCGAWDSLTEHQQTQLSSAGRQTAIAQPLHMTTTEENTRLITGIGEMDRVLGGGIVPGSLVLIGGDPGIGKSTLILQLLASLAAKNLQMLYVTGEESAAQIRMRAERLKISGHNISISTENSVEAIIDLAGRMHPALMAVDSIQTMYSEEVGSAPGSVTQVREATARLLQLAKINHIPVLLVGHVTKDGAIAGPRVLEHMVDTVLYFEGDRGQVFRILRTVKNRFGSTNEIGVFEMQDSGLIEVSNPSALFLAERPVNVSGSVVLPSVEGTRPILVEVQALVSRSSLGTARRTAIGADPQRLALLTAVLEKKLGIALYDHDIFLNIAGGIRISEPALDLGVVAALLSSYLDKPIDANTVVCGEIGLAGEIRAVGQMEQRVREAGRLGFQTFLMPESSARQLQSSKKEKMRVLAVRGVSELAEHLFTA